MGRDAGDRPRAEAHIWKQPWHLTSMKKELGDCTSRFRLFFCFSRSTGGVQEINVARQHLRTVVPPRHQQLAEHEARSTPYRDCWPATTDSAWVASRG